MDLKATSIWTRPVYKRITRLGLEAFWIAVGQAVTVLGGLVGVRLLTNVLAPMAYGQLALGMTLATLVQQVALGPLGGAFLRFFSPAEKDGQLASYWQAIQVLLKQVTFILIGIIALVALGMWLVGYTNWLGLILAAFTFALISGYNSSMDRVQNAARQRVIVAWHQALGQWLRFLIAVLLVGLLGAFSTVAMLGYALASVIVLCSQYVFFRRKILARIPARAKVNQSDVKDWTRQMWNYAWPFMTWGVFTWVQIASDRWALELFGTTSDVGLYAVLYQLGYYPLMLLSNFMVTFISPILFSQAGDGSNPIGLSRAHRLNGLVVLCSVMLTVVGTALGFLLHKQVFSLLVAPQYRVVSALLPIMLMSGGLFASGQAASLLLLTELNSQGLIAPKIATAVLGILLNICGAYWFGLRGVVYASVLFSLMYFLWVILLARRRAACVV